MDNSAEAIRVLIVDDHPVVRAGLVSMLGTRSELHIVGSVANGLDGLSVLAREQIDVILLDLRMPGMNGLDMLAALKRISTAAKVVVLTTYEMDEDIYQAMHAGAHGYLLKDTSLQEMIDAIQAVHQGKRFLPKHIASALAERMSRAELSPREVEILAVVAKGLTNREIGSVLRISENTVRNHINSIMEKLEVSGRTEAATTAIRRGIIPPS